MRALASMGFLEFLVNIVEISEMTQAPYLSKNIDTSRKFKNYMILNIFACSFLRRFLKLLTLSFLDVKLVNSFLPHEMS